MSTSPRKFTQPSPQTDPLYVIFEHHLYNFLDPDVDRKTFICKVIAEYIGFLRSKNISVPPALEQPIVEELACQVNTMLFKKIYGCHDMGAFQKTVKPVTKKKARAEYTRLAKAPSRKAPARENG